MAKILLIDDDAELRDFVQHALEQLGHDVSCLERADSALTVLSAGQFDLVLVDQHMPGMAGSEFLMRLRQKELRVRAILMTGLATGALVEPMRALDAFVVTKPAGGYGEFWKNLEAVLKDALQGETEIVAAIGRAVHVALKAGKTNLVDYLRALLDRELLTQVSTEVHGDADEARRILGVPLPKLIEEGSPLSFREKAVLLIANHPELNVDDYAERLDCSRSKLYRDPTIKQALRLRHAAGGRPPRGFKTAEGAVDAWDD